MVPELHSYVLGKELVTEQVDTHVSKPTKEILALIGDFQSLPDPKVLPVVETEDYQTDAANKIQGLFRNGHISEKMAGSLAVYYDDHAESLNAFGTVFCHGDMQRKNLGRRNARLAAFDLEQAHMGSELEDFVFFAISSRRPLDKAKVYGYLRDKFSSNGVKSANFQEAMNLMALDRFLHVLHWNSFNKDPNAANNLIGAYSRYMIGKIMASDEELATSKKQLSFESEPAKD